MKETYRGDLHPLFLPVEGVSAFFADISSFKPLLFRAQAGFWTK